MSDVLFDLPADSPGNLTDRFGVPPLTVLDRRQGYWQARKRRWLDRGIDSGAGRAEELTYTTTNPELRELMLGISGGTSVFDPVIAELAIRWWSPAGGYIYDPFAGGSVRALVAGALGRSYLGVDVRTEQIEENEAQLATYLERHGPLPDDAQVSWTLADGTQPVVEAESADLVLTCPPYGDLEVYSEQPDDISTMDHDEFCDAYTDAVHFAAQALKPNRFAVWVVGNYRSKRRGMIRDLVGLTVAAHAEAGLEYHSELVIVDPVGTHALRAARLFPPNRRPVRSHQQVLVFAKGNVRAAADAAQPITEAQQEAWWT